MIKTPLSFADTPFFSTLVKDYVAHNERVLPFSKYFPDWKVLDGFSKQNYPLKIDRNLLCDVLLQQYEGFDSSNIRKNIALLRQENSFCVVTAHQLCLMGGPLYFVIKIANAIRLSRELAVRFPDRNFVPVYWMGSEDHDFEEINHIRLFGQKISWENKQGGPVGRYTTEGIMPLVSTLQDILGNDAFAEELIELMKTAYSQENMQLATRALVHQLFGKYGLVIVNGDDRLLKKAMIPVIKDELLHQSSAPRVAEQSKALEEAGYHAQATPREINLFFLRPNKRERLEWLADEGMFAAGDRRFGREELLDILEQQPESFSPNVVLRPVFQQGVLPAIAFIGGGGELAYWMQLGKVFELHNTAFPVLVARTSLLYINAGLGKKISKLNLSLTDLFLDTEVLKKQFATADNQSEIDFSDVQAELEKWMNVARLRLEAIDKTLGPVAGAELQKMTKAVEQLQGRAVRTLKQKAETELRQIEQIKESLFPDGGLQERTDNFMNIYAKEGPAFIDMLVNDLLPIEEEFVVVG